MADIHFPAEWDEHEAVWSAWPSAADLWEDNLAPAREEVAALFEAIAMPDPDDDSIAGEIVHVLLRGEEARNSAEAMLDDLIRADRLFMHEAPIGDIWLRDTGPIFVKAGGGLTASRFGFNGWGGKYLLESDDEIAPIVAKIADTKLSAHDFILEGGAIDTDGQGTILTTRQCVLNPNRNKGMTEERFEALMAEALGIEKVIWLDDGLLNDHTDGHVDNIARFVAPGKVVCMAPSGEDDPNRDAYRAIRDALAGARDATGRRLEVIEIPSPGRILNEDGEVVPASHMNFYIANKSLIVPVYATNEKQEGYAIEAVELLADAVGREHVHAIDATHVLTGGGSFHCITQQQPK